MPKKPKKSLDPEWQAQRRKSRHRLKAHVSIRVEVDRRDRWHQAAERAGLSLRDWIIHHLDAAADAADRKESKS